ncbi:von Willebrand factor type A domain-containing protein [Kribbella sp. VKM Ac-2571]|uniref:LodA/GoxA family CTQ-dependent oxidase n=1 Tax=Kribbella sp. VKM Ac-2571 TaxID=2512222 RepID=UPI0010618E26|nr:LodA/GoxA family CTQ-dependent oxidase [Kribbella sp. VKM Ac-2571]TDO58991.1 von Willebrand factor type A domain-containing protein [Kribbella sp. VKM Ac-2571]
MATTYKIHPAIGIARVGNSPDEFFVGPEHLGERPEPPGGFKDAQCRVKRQAARFRIFAHHDDGSVDEIDDAAAEISWTVHLVNAKAAHPNRGNSEPIGQLTIDPGPRTLTGPDQRELFDTGTIDFSGQPSVTVPLGEIRSDDDNHLLVLGGHGAAASPAGNVIGSFWGNAGWYDDVSDGPVTATITLRSDNSTPPVEGAWAIVAPPKFAPHQDSVTTLYDRVLQHMIDLGLVPAPTTTSYTNDVCPILQRARDMRWVEGIFGAHSWPDPVTSQPLVDAIFARLRPPGDMPRLNGGDSALTPTQYAHMQRWQAGNYTADWTGVPAPQTDLTPDGMDRAALEACVGGAFFPGIEAGGLSAGDRPIIETSYAAAFRISSTAGTISQAMALPWHADFKACGDNWWPVPRPNDVIAQDTGSQARWDRDVTSMDDMVTLWHTLGFVVEQGAEHVEVEHCDESSITLLTPELRFIDVPQGPMGMVREAALAISFEVLSPGSAVTLDYAPGGAPAHPQLVAATTSVTVGPTAPNGVATARLWVVYRTGAAPSSIPPQVLTVREAASGQTWDVTVTGNTVARKTAATALVLDRSGSMSEDRGDGQSKHVALQQAANIFVDLMLEGDGVGIVRYNEDAQPLQSVLELGTGGLSDLNRNATHDTINGAGLDPQGATSIGDGIFEGRALLDAAPPYDVKSLVVLTDGIENSPRLISDVAAQINERTYAVGLGQPQNISVPALQTISGNNGGYLLVTGAISTDNRFLLQKYFLQVLAGISNAEVVLDPDGELSVGAVHRIPFQLSDGDSGVDVVLLTPRPEAVDFRLQTPNGLLIEPWRAQAEPAMRYVTGDGVAYYRITLPVQLRPGRFDQAGTWHALLTIGRPHTGRTPDDSDGVDLSILRGRANQPLRSAASARPARRPFEFERAFAVANEPAEGEQPGQRGLPYSLVVHSYSNVSLRAAADQRSFEPGAEVTINATLTQSGVPVDGDPSVWADVTRPDGSVVTLVLDGVDDFTASFGTTLPGVYRIRVRARGRTRVGRPFTRERTLTAAVWRGGDNPPAPSGGDSFCEWLSCLFKDGVIDEKLIERLRRLGFDLDALRKCLRGCGC